MRYENIESGWDITNFLTIGVTHEGRRWVGTGHYLLLLPKDTNRQPTSVHFCFEKFEHWQDLDNFSHPSCVNKAELEERLGRLKKQITLSQDAKIKAVEFKHQLSHNLLFWVEGVAQPIPVDRQPVRLLQSVHKGVHFRVNPDDQTFKDDGLFTLFAFDEEDTFVGAIAPIKDKSLLRLRLHEEGRKQ